MPDLASQIEESVLDDPAIDGSVLEGSAFQDAEFTDNEFEPDEDTLITALRNQDDIPILMDIVAEKLAASASQEGQLSEAMEGFSSAQNDAIPVLLKEEQATPLIEPETRLESMVETTQQDSEADDRQALIAQAVTAVLEKRLPDLVQEVLQAMDELSTQEK
ncbi:MULTISPECIES: hypothetical protein [Marinomonas]|jgi:hypothetical protein|uniref:hypothetical protein n=2 Tax=Oceanospirillaceae TaxID=135620 RepID=UPI001055724C|nr:hypothetical protein [Marinomonas sp. KMM3893]